MSRKKKAQKKTGKSVFLAIATVALFLMFIVILSDSYDRTSLTNERINTTTTTTTLQNEVTENDTEREYKYYAPDLNSDRLTDLGYTYRGWFSEEIAKKIGSQFDNSVVYNYYGQWKVWVKEIPNLPPEPEVIEAYSTQELGFGFAVGIEVLRA